ncbi:MAG: hypothetical protein L0154_04520 [Chloroflexi bacterium]|nr:hypothetical protein [Chloroflexota bacterium]
MKRMLWVIIPLLTLLSFPAQAQNKEEPIEVPAAVVNSMVILHPYFPAGEWKYSFSSREPDTIDVFAIAPERVIVWTFQPIFIFDIEAVERIVDQDWVDVITSNYDNTRTIGRCILDDTYLLYEIAGTSNDKDFTIHYWVWIDDTGWNEFLAAIGVDYQLPVLEFEEEYFGTRGTCKEE